MAPRTLLIPSLLGDWFPLLQYVFASDRWDPVLLTEEGRKKFLKAWQERKRDTLTHPYLNEKMSWGMIPYVQALLLARHLRGDLDAYPPFLWK